MIRERVFRTGDGCAPCFDFAQHRMRPAVTNIRKIVSFLCRRGFVMFKYAKFRVPDFQLRPNSALSFTAELTIFLKVHDQLRKVTDNQDFF